ncbi:DNA polymerase subunit Cdc27 [Fusarium avenaceum]|nr:DNA polymerase subunit Cdc27 [Fusarium avenaceum]
MDEHKRFLADRLLSEERPITYRLLSRALDVHVNTAKEMLYDFHNYQNAQKTNSVHATYLVYGTKAPESQQPDGDVEMSSSMPEEPLSDEVPTSTITLAREEELKDTLAAYQKVTSIHVYSLAPHPQKDLTLLSDITTQLSEYSLEDITAASKKYGSIGNPNAQRRERKGRTQASAPAPPNPAKKDTSAPKSTSSTTVKQEAPASKPETKQTKSIKQESSATSSKEGTPAPSGGKKPAPSLKRGVSGGIMQSFAKAAARPAKPKAAPKKEEDTAMALSDDGEADDSDIVGTSSKSKPVVDSGDIKRKRQEREDALRKMMEDDDEDEKEESDKESEQADEEMEEAPEPEAEPEPESQKEEKEPAEMISSTGDGRRRGKRRVMKKKRILDDQGYMVTIQEPGWESFSEDEAPAPAKKAAPTPTPSSSAGSKAKKAATKGQGNIMSFFAKK